MASRWVRVEPPAPTKTEKKRRAEKVFVPVAQFSDGSTVRLGTVAKQGRFAIAGKRSDGTPIAKKKRSGPRYRLVKADPTRQRQLERELEEQIAAPRRLSKEDEPSEPSAAGRFEELAGKDRPSGRGLLLERADGSEVLAPGGDVTRLEISNPEGVKKGRRSYLDDAAAGIRAAPSDEGGVTRLSHAPR